MDEDETDPDQLTEQREAKPGQPRRKNAIAHVYETKKNFDDTSEDE